jgi:meso-butanediol dehydrogenase / (S,S)-butanediol dehydrogenase / diacetyl reductase
MTGRFENKIALITGAGSGMGRAITIRLAGEGASLLAVDIDAGRLEETKGLTSGTLAVHQTDLSEPLACADAMRCARASISSAGSTSSATSPASISPST